MPRWIWVIDYGKDTQLLVIEQTVEFIKRVTCITVVIHRVGHRLIVSTIKQIIEL